MISRLILLVAALYVLGFEMSAQTIDDIKNSGRYYWGIGKGATMEQADQEALAQMSRQVQVSVISKTSETEDRGETSQYDFQQTFSQSRFQDTGMKILHEEPQAEVLRYLLKSEYTKIQQKRESRIKDLVETGKIAEERLQIDDALRCYYQALLLSRLKGGVKVSFGDHEGFAKSVLPLKIRSVLQNIRAEVSDGEQMGNRYNTRLRFTYNGHPVSSVTFTYNDGQGIVGPVKGKEGIGEAELVGIPASGKLHLTYETRFRSELDPLDGDLAMLYNGASHLPSFTEAGVDIPIKIKGGNIRAGKAEKGVAIATGGVTIKPQPTRNKTSIPLRSVQNGNTLFDKVKQVEEAIRSGNSMMARDCFTPEGFSLFHRLMTQCGQVALVGSSNYEFVEADGYLVGRFTRIKLKYRGGKSFTENLVYRFDKQSGKIRSVAFALSKIGEEDIMNAAAQWPEVSRWAVLSFMEDYQTAFALKRDDYISSIFSDDAIIITGAVLKKMNANDQGFDSNRLVNFGLNNNNVKYSKLTKSEYIARLQKIFKEREYVNLSFENNVTKIVNTPSIFSRGALFGIEIKQRYVSAGYSDDGYLTLLFDTRGELPIIYYRMWQPDKTEMMGLQEFIDNIPK